MNGVEFAKREAGNKLATVKRLSGESIAFYAERIRRLVNRAYNNYPVEARDEQALKAFIEGLPAKRGFKLKMKLQAFNALHQAVEYASLLDQVLIEEQNTEYQPARGADIDDTVNDDSDDELEMMRKSYYDQKKKYSKFDKKKNKVDNRERSSVCANCGHADPKPDFKTKQNSPCYLCSELGHWADTCKLKETQTKTEGKDLNC